jgi:peroxiredoxin (alkyl hydroperoxide reductase subunit C)
MEPILRVGQSLQPFELDAYLPTQQKIQRLRATDIWQKGQWLVLFFYPADFTFVCPTELADLAEVYPALQSLGVEVWSVSADTAYAHLAWQQSEKLLANVRYPMAADPTGHTSRRLGVYDSETGLTLRGTFIFNPDGRLVGCEIVHYDVGRSAQELLRKMQAYRYVSEHPGEVCPARWTPGQATLKPSEVLVGHVAEALAKN